MQDTKKIVKKCIIFSLLMLFLVIFSYLYAIKTIVVTNFGEKKDKENIFNLYKSNYQIFQNVITELKEYKQFVISKENESYYVRTPFKSDSVIVDDSNKDKYENCIEIMEKLNIEHITKSDHNVSFYIKNSLGQNIVYITNKGIYERDHSVIDIENIYGYWYYTEED